MRFLFTIEPQEKTVNYDNYSDINDLSCLRIQARANRIQEYISRVLEP